MDTPRDTRSRDKSLAAWNEKASPTAETRVATACWLQRLRRLENSPCLFDPKSPKSSNGAPAW